MSVISSSCEIADSIDIVTVYACSYIMSTVIVFLSSAVPRYEISYCTLNARRVNSVRWFVTHLDKDVNKLCFQVRGRSAERECPYIRLLGRPDITCLSDSHDL